MSQEPQHIGKLLEQLFARSRARQEAATAAAVEIHAAIEKTRQEANAARTRGAVEHLRACGVDPVTLEAFQGDRLRSTAALRGVLSWLDTEKPFCVLTGGVGGGKSVAAAYALLRATRTVQLLPHPLADEPITIEELDRRRGLWIRASDLRHSSRFGDGKEVALVDQAATVPWLALDELRAADVKGAGLERLEEVLGERYARARRTVITSNHTQLELRQLLGERLSSRLAEGAFVVDAGDSDLRRAKAREEAQP